jgi:hypothetical protein
MAILAAKYYGSVTVGSELVESRNSINPRYLRMWSPGLNNLGLAENNKSGAF